MIKTAAEVAILAVQGISASGSTAIGMATIGTATNTTSNLTLDSTWVPLGLFLAGIATTATVVWKVATQKSKFESAQKAQKTLHKLEINELRRRVKLLEDNK